MIHGERLEEARLYWAVRELRRIELCGGQLPAGVAEWLRANWTTPQFAAAAAHRRTSSSVRHCPHASTKGRAALGQTPAICRTTAYSSLTHGAIPLLRSSTSSPSGSSGNSTWRRSPSLPTRRKEPSQPARRPASIPHRMLASRAFASAVRKGISSTSGNPISTGLTGCSLVSVAYTMSLGTVGRSASSSIPEVRLRTSSRGETRFEISRIRPALRSPLRARRRILKLIPLLA